MTNTDTFWYCGKIPVKNDESHVISVPTSLLNLEMQHLSFQEWDEDKWRYSVNITNTAHSTSDSVQRNALLGEDEELTLEEALELAEQTSVIESANDITSEEDVSYSTDVNESVFNLLATLVPVSFVQSKLLLNNLLFLFLEWNNAIFCNFGNIQYQ